MIINEEGTVDNGINSYPKINKYKSDKISQNVPGKGNPF